MKFRHSKSALHFALMISGLVLPGLLSAATSMVASKPIVVPDSHGGFDFIEIDPNTSRLLAPHTKNGTFDIFDLADSKLLKACAVGASQDSAVSLDGKYFVTCSAKPRLLTIDAKSLEITGETPLPGPADIVAFNPKNARAYVGHDDASEIWVIDVTANKIIATVAVPEGPEGIVCDPENDRVYVNVRKSSEVIVIDTKENKVVANWSTAPATVPHGLAADLALHRLFAAGANGKLVEIDTNSGKVVGTADIGPKVDQIAYDPEFKRIYSASGSGVMSVTQAKEDGLESLGDVATYKGARSVAVDAKSHAVWTAYGEGDKSYLLRLDPTK